MNRIEDYTALKNRINKWLVDYFDKSKSGCFVVGVSGGIDSAVVSTLAAETGKQVYALNMPIHQKPEQEGLSAGYHRLTGQWTVGGPHISLEVDQSILC